MARHMDRHFQAFAFIQSLDADSKFEPRWMPVLVPDSVTTDEALIDHLAKVAEARFGGSVRHYNLELGAYMWNDHDTAFHMAHRTLS